MNKWEQPIALIAAAYSSYMFPALAAKASHRATIRALRPLVALVVLGVLMVLGAIALAPWLVDTFLGSRYSGSVNLLRLSLLGAILVLVAQPLAILLQARDQEHHVAVVTVAAKVLAVLAVVLFAKRFGATVSPVAAGTSTALVAGMFLLRARQLWLTEPRAAQSS